MHVVIFVLFLFPPPFFEGLYHIWIYVINASVFGRIAAIILGSCMVSQSDSSNLEINAFTHLVQLSMTPNYRTKSSTVCMIQWGIIHVYVYEFIYASIFLVYYISFPFA